MAEPDPLPAVLARLAGLPATEAADLARADQDARWRAGESAPAEDYLAGLPQVAADAEHALVLVYGEVLARAARGERPTLAEYQARFPHVADRLAVQFEVHAALAASPSVTGPVTGPAVEAFPADRLRAYLELLATRELRDDPGVISRSDLVQQTLLEAWKDRDRFRGRVEAEWLGWARQILARNLADARRRARRQQRDVRRERSLQDELDRSSAELGGWLAADGPPPGQGAILHERAARLAWALAQLPEAQREALVFQHWEGLTLTQIAGRLGRTPAAVAGLLKRGLARLRELLPDPD